MALLQDLEARIRRDEERKKRIGAKPVQAARGFLYAAVVVAVIVIIVVAVALSPDGSFFGRRPSGYEDRLTNQLVGLVRQGAETVLPSDATIASIRKRLAKGDFALLTTPDVKSAKTNTTIGYDVRVIRGEGFEEPVSVSATNLPTGVTASSTPEVVQKTEERSLVNLTIPAAAPVGQYQFAIVGRAAEKEKTALASLAVSSLVLSNAQLQEVKPMAAGTKWQTTIAWDTDVPANTWVEYAAEQFFTENGQTYSFTSTNDNISKTHTITLSFLEPDTVYHYRIKSVDSVNNIVFGNDRVFITQAAEEQPTETQ